jgi:dienelactone hydrolase
VLLLGFIQLASCQKRDILAGIDKDALFAAPTAAELDVIQADWQQRSLVPQNVTIENTYTINSRLNLNMISFRLDGLKQYAGVLVPVTSNPLPVQIFVYGFALEDPTSYRIFKLSSDTTTPSFIYVVPALRGQSLIFVINDIEYKTPMSEGTRNDAFDGATDDAIACLNAVGIAFDEADTTKVAARGGSRGGTVALLMAERDKRIKLAVGIAFPSDLLALTATHVNDDTYQFQFLTALIEKRASLEETRRKMIASSPLYFCQQLPKTQIHYGKNDKITPATQGELLLNAMKALSMEDKIDLFIYPGRSHSDIANNNTELETRIHEFFEELL